MKQSKRLQRLKQHRMLITHEWLQQVFVNAERQQRKDDLRYSREQYRRLIIDKAKLKLRIAKTKVIATQESQANGGEMPLSMRRYILQLINSWEHVTQTLPRVKLAARAKIDEHSIKAIGEWQFRRWLNEGTE